MKSMDMMWEKIKKKLKEGAVMLHSKNSTALAFGGIGVCFLLNLFAATSDLIWTPNYSSNSVAYGWSTRQGACHAINLDTAIEHTPGVPSLQFIVTPNDNAVPGVNSPPLGGCFAVDRQGSGTAWATAAALIKSANLGEGSDIYLGMSMFIPYTQTDTTNGDTTGPAPPNNVFPYANMRSNGNTATMQFMEFYGAPFGGPSPTGLSFGGNGVIHDYANNYLWWTGGSYNGDHIWYSPKYTYDTWHDMVFHILFSSNASVGFLEMWYDGARQTFRDGSQTFHYASINRADSVGPIGLNLQQYNWNMPYTLTIYFGADVKLGTSYAAVAPGAVGIIQTSNAVKHATADLNIVGMEIRYSVPQRSAVTLELYTILGQKVAKLVDGTMEAGSYAARVGGGGSGLHAGFYVVKLKVGEVMLTKHIICLR